MQKEIKLLAGQNLRYTGRAFPGFIKELPYMTFIAYHNASQCVVDYNKARVIINTRRTTVIC